MFSKFPKPTKEFGRRLLSLATLCLCLSLFCGVGAAEELEELTASNPGKTDPFGGDASFILRNDSAVVLVNDPNQIVINLFAISPDKSLDLQKDTQKTAFSGGTIHHDIPKTANMFLDRDGKAYLAWGATTNWRTHISVVRADRFNIDYAGTPKSFNLFDDIKYTDHIHGILSGRWDSATDDQDLFVVGLSKYPENKVLIQGVKNVRYDEKTNVWTEPVFGPTTEIALDCDDSAMLAEVRAVAGDFDGDGVQDIAVAYMGRRKDVKMPYRIKVLRVAPVKQSVGSAAWYELKELSDIDTGLDWGAWSGGTLRQAAFNYASAFDISAGDVDKDGRDEIFFAAAALSGAASSPRTGIEGKMFKLNEKNDAVVAMNGIEPIHSLGYDTNRVLLVRTAVGDIDSDGAEEPVVLHRDNDGTYLGACKYSATGTNKFSSQNVYGESVRAIDIKIGNYSGEMKPGALGANGAEVMFGVWSTRNGGERYVRYMAFDSWQASSRFKERTGNYWIEALPPPSWEDVKKYSNQLMLVTGDFRRASIRLGAPVHIHKDTDFKLITVMQEPPKHVDYTMSTAANKHGVVNLTRVGSFYTDFYSGTENAKKTSSNHTSDSHMGVNVKTSIKAGYEADLGPIGSAEASVETSHSVGASAGLKVAKTNESYSSTQTEVTAKTTDDDHISFSAGGMDIWRYPIVGKYSQVSPDHQLWHTIAIPIPVKSSNFVAKNVSAYQPSWCNGNILSYPRKAAMIADYKESALLTPETPFSVANNITSHKLSWSKGNQDQGSLEASAKLEVDSSIGFHAKASAMGFTTEGSLKIKVHADSSYAYTKTSTTSFNTKTDIGIVQAGRFNDLYNASNQYNASSFIYRTDAGVVKTSYTVDIPQENMKWWTDRYSAAPDVALNLPYLWVPSGGSWKIDESETTNPKARRIRGFFMTKGDRNVDSGIEETGTINLMCRIHNFAVKRDTENDATASATAKNVKVKFEYAAYDTKGKLGKRSTIATQTIREIPVWNNDGNKPNWEFAITPWDITNVPDGRYRIFVTVNPERAFKELPHHGLETSWYDETCDNNHGWYDVAILKPQKTTADLASARAADADEPLGVYPNGTVDLSFAGGDFAFAENDESDVVTITANVRNDGETAAMNVPVTLYLGDPREDGSVALALEVLPGVFPGETTTAVFTLDASSETLAGAEKDDFALVIGTKLGEIDESTNLLVPQGGDGGGGSSGCAAGAGALALLCLLGTGIAASRRK